MKNKPIYVTQPFLPPLAEFIPLLEKIWSHKILTNNGKFHQDFEKSLGEYLGVEHVSLFANATLALLTALKAMEITGEVITTPYSFVATSHALLWNNLTPVFVDIDPETLNLDPTKIEQAITPNTTAIMPVHCYGTPCDVERIQKIANEHNLKVIYDAAHAFGVCDNQGSVLRHGNLSVVSFHATKVLNTFEGGAIICADKALKQRIDKLKNFGFENEVSVESLGINGKMSEFNAALGLLQLKYIDQSISKRRQIDQMYRQNISKILGIECLKEAVASTANHSYFPILVHSEYPISRDKLYDRLKENGISARRYFYPLITNFPMYQGFHSAAKEQLPVANQVAEKILCLPIYPDLDISSFNEIISILRHA